MARQPTKKPAAIRAPRRRVSHEPDAQPQGPALTHEDIRKIFAGMAVLPPGFAQPSQFMPADGPTVVGVSETMLQKSIENASSRVIDLGDSVSRLLHRLGDSVLAPPMPQPPGTAQANIPEPTNSPTVASINELADGISRVHDMVREIHERLEA